MKLQLPNNRIAYLLLFLGISGLLGVGWFVFSSLFAPSSSLKFGLSDNYLKPTLSLTESDNTLLSKFDIDLSALNSSKIRLSTSSASLLSFLDQANISFRSKPHRVEFESALPRQDLPSEFRTDFADPWSELTLFPKESFLLLKSDRLKKYLNFDGSYLLKEDPNPVSLGVFSLENSLNFALIQTNRNSKSTKEKLSSLKKIPLSTESNIRTEGAGEGLSENVIGGVETKSISLSDSSLVLTFGVVDDKLVIASSPEAFKTVLDVYGEKLENLAANEEIVDYVRLYRLRTNLNIFIDLKKIRELGMESIKDQSKGFLKLTYDKQGASVIDRLLKAKGMLITVNSGQRLTGAIDYD